MKSFSQQINGKLYLNSELRVFQPTTDEISSFQFAQSAMQSAPNEQIVWLQGEYVAGDTPNRNGQLWTSDEVSIKSVTARLMPVTVMHDFRTAVGVIADTKLVEEETSDDTPGRVKLTTVLAIWAHRFPDIAQEIAHNAEMGTLMQSQECDAPSYECSSCGQVFVKPVEESQHCDHLKTGESSRTLRDVTFTGTGLIFGSRGAEGANPNAKLDTVMAEVARWSDVKNGIEQRKQETANVDTIEIKRAEYDELKARPSRDDFDAIKAKLDEAEESRDAAVKAQEEAEVARKAAEDAKVAADDELATLKGEVEADEMAKERMDAVDDELSAALPDSIKERLVKQARTMSDDEWSERITELSELVKVEAKPNEGGQTFSADEISKFNGQGKKGSTSVDPTQIGRALYKNAVKA
jgi:hypothetical protein